MAAQSPLSPHRRRRQDHIARALRLGALTLALLAGPAAGQAAAATRVVLHLPTGVRTLSDADVQDADVLSEDYVLRSPGNEEHETLSGLSVGKMLQKVGYAPNEGFMRLDRADGTWTTLSADELGDPSPFQAGLKPIVFLDSVRTRFFRPVRDATDENAADNLATQPGEPLEFWLQTGAPLKVTATGSKDTAARGEQITFSASVSGQHSGERVNVEWRFDDGGAAPGDSVTHAFTADGVYGVVAIARGDDDSGGASKVLRVRVGSPASNDGPGAGGGTNTGPAPATGPARGPSTATGVKRPNRRPGANGGAGDTGDRPGGKTSTPSATATPAVTSAPPPTVTAPATTAPSTTSPGPGSSRPLPETKPRSAPTPPEEGELVRGTLVSASAPLPLPAASAPVRAGARAAAQAGAAATPLSLTGLGVLLLLAGGAWWETRGRRRRGPA